jgi:hypothetical protein
VRGLLVIFALIFVTNINIPEIMKKITAIILITVLIFFLPSISFSQGKTPVKLGLKVAPNIGWMNPGTKGYVSDGPCFGGTIGFITDVYFAENYAFSTGLNFQSISGKLNYHDSLLVENTNILQYGDVARKYNFLYVEIPVTVKMKTKTFGKMSYFGQIGFGTGFRIRTTVVEEFTPSSGSTVEQQYDYDQGTTLIREALLLGLGLEYHLDESSRILVGVSYSNSLNDLLILNNYSTGLPEKSTLNFVELNIGFIF